MSFISYAQNFEDVMLWRALRHIETGFYIDVGANDPEADSVTKAFYDLGWRGINIEPVPQWFQRLQETRLRDINLQLAVGSKPGEITLFEIPDTGLSTATKDFAERHEAEHGYQSRKLKVPLDTLTNVCERYHTAPVHFLKIDVEGMEKAVLEGIEFTKVRPWIVLVESTLPNRQEECHGDWEPILLGAGYQYAYYDGINRFYVAEEHPELIGAFQAPPNFFDSFILKRHLDIEAQAKQVQEQLHVKEREFQAKQAELEQLHVHSQWLENAGDAAKAKIDELNHSSHHWWTVADGLHRELQVIYNSKSWRITWPLRKLMQFTRWILSLLTRWFFLLPKKAARYLLSELIHFTIKRPSIRLRATHWLNNHSHLKDHLRLFAQRRGLLPGAFQHAQSLTKPSIHSTSPHDANQTEQVNLSLLTPRARQIYQELKTAVEKNRGQK